MATNHYHYDRSTLYGARLFNALNQLNAALRSFSDERDCMVQMKLTGGQAGDDATYHEQAVRYGFVSDAEAHAAFLQIDSAYAAYLNDKAAIDQMLSQLR